jgi:hypothetical protein
MPTPCKPADMNGLPVPQVREAKDAWTGNGTASLGQGKLLTKTSANRTHEAQPRAGVVFIIVVLLPQVTWGQQNLVPNGSFEESTSCPTSSAQMYLSLPWTNFGLGLSSDYYNSCSPPIIFPPDTFPNMSVPVNGGGIQQAKTGEAYGGIYTYGGVNETNGREYLQVVLAQPLHPGRYIVSFWASLADRFAYAVGSLGAFLSDTLVTRTSFNSLPGVEPSIQSPPGQIFTDKDIWYLITDTFTSRAGGERYLAIGNFKSTAESDTLFVPTSPNDRLKSYYYIDDVSVVALDSVPDGVEDEGRIPFTMYPNPVSDVLRIESTVQLRNTRLMDALGKEVYSQAVEGQTHTLHLRDLPAGIYLIEVQDTQGRRVVQRVVKVGGP